MSTILITGATQGLGRHLALELARPGNRLLLHGRDQSRLEALAATILAGDAPAPGSSGQTGSPATGTRVDFQAQAEAAVTERSRHVRPDARSALVERSDLAPVQVRTVLADLADLAQVAALGDDLVRTEGRLEVVVHNAAVGGGPDLSRRVLSGDGHELRFAVNHLAPALLTRRLLPLLRASAPARIVNVASMGQAPIDFDNVMLDRGYDGIHAYCQAKLAMVMDTFDLAEQLAGTGVTANVLHPAHLMATTMVRETGLTAVTDTAEGTAPVLRLIGDPELADVSGRYFDQFTETRAHEQAYDPAARARLRAVTATLLVGF